MIAFGHLILRGTILHPASDWILPAGVWTVAWILSGEGYLIGTGMTRGLREGETLVAAGNSNLYLRAASIGEFKIKYFIVRPPLLDGILTVAEGQILDRTASRVETLFVFAANDPISQKMSRLVRQSSRDALLVRGSLVQVWTQAISKLLIFPSAEPGQKLRDRFRRLVAQLPEAELATNSMGSLAEMLSCSERHFRRLFRAEFGVSLRSRQIELRLRRAHRLLQGTDLPLVEVACESGYSNIRLFNSAFSRRFGMTPIECREGQGSVPVTES
ncbi:MAG: AraC family transcriptional regulator [Verrucomicrobiota bacterium]